MQIFFTILLDRYLGWVVSCRHKARTNKGNVNNLKHKAYEDTKGIDRCVFSYHVPVGCRVSALLCPRNGHSGSHLHRIVLCIPGSGMLAGHGDHRERMRWPSVRVLVEQGD